MKDQMKDLPMGSRDQMKDLPKGICYQTKGIVLRGLGIKLRIFLRELYIKQKGSKGSRDLTKDPLGASVQKKIFLGG